MSYRIVLKAKFEEDIRFHLKSGNRKLVLKVSSFLDEIKEHPSTGTGKPEQLKGQINNVWSRRIDARHRLLYQIKEEELIVARGHYDDK